MKDLTKKLRKGNNMKKNYFCTKWWKWWGNRWRYKKRIWKIKSEEEKEESEEEDEDNDDEISKKEFSIYIELYEYDNKKHLLRYVRKSGALDEFL